MTNPLENLSFVTLFNAVADAMLLTNEDGQVILANESAQQLLNYNTIEEMLGLSVEVLMPSAYREHHAQLRTNYIKQPKKRLIGNGKGLAVLTQDGRSLPVDIGLSPIECEGKHFVLVSFHAADKQVEAEVSLKTSEERLRLAKAAVGIGVFDIGLGFKDVRYDALIKELFGFLPSDSIPYDDFVSVIDADDQDNWQAMFDHAIRTEEECEYQIDFRVNNRLYQTQHWVHAAGKVFFKDHVAVRMLGVVQDVTDQRLLQQKLSKQRVELESLAKKQIAIQTASAIAHEINQPLAAISAYSEVALYALKADKPDAERLSRSLLGCVTQANRAGNTLHELMQFLQKGKIDVTPIDLNEIVCEALDITKHNGYGGFRSSVNLEPTLPQVLANRTQLQKVLVNLIRNGIEAVHSVGVPVAKIHVKVCTYADLNMAEVVIQDNGPGLTQEVQQRVFEPFFTTKPQGIGMGLPISRSLIEASGGQLWFDADASSGAVFHLTLPFANS